tara:strand:+ start:166940 stop:167170 length:231 start_codon:yes stop_codon:yes gene_type:complete
MKMLDCNEKILTLEKREHDRGCLDMPSVETQESVQKRDNFTRSVAKVNLSQNAPQTAIRQESLAEERFGGSCVTSL